MLYIFDVGNVVLNNINVISPAAKSLGIDEQEFRLDYSFYDHPLMDGTMTCDDYYRHVEHVFNVKVSGKPFSDFFSPVFNEPMVEVIEKLKAKGHRVVCGSNTFKPHWDIIEKKGQDRVFDKCYLSHVMGMTKPAKAFFRYILKSEGVEPGSAFFTDDMQENVDAASSLGIKTFRYEKELDNLKLAEIFSL